MRIKQKSCTFRLIKRHFHYTTMATNYFSQSPLREKLCLARTTLLQHLCIRTVFDWLANCSIAPFKEEKDVPFLFGTYFFAKERYSQRSGRLIPFMPSKVTRSFSPTENLTLSTKNNVFMTFHVSFKSVNRSRYKQFTPSCGSSSLETNPVFHHVWKRSYHNLTLFYNGTIFLLKEEKKTFTKRNLRRIMLFQSVFGEQVHFTSHSVGKGMSWDKILRSKGFVFTPMTLSLKRKKSFRTANRIAKLIYFIEKWSIRSLKQTKKATGPSELVSWIWH